VKRALEKREPKIYENDKTAIFVRGGHTSETVTQFLAELVSSSNYNNYVELHCLLSCVLVLYSASGLIVVL